MSRRLDGIFSSFRLRTNLIRIYTISELIFYTFNRINGLSTHRSSWYHKEHTVNRDLVAFIMATPRGTEFTNLLVLSASFTAVFTAYLAIQNLQSSLNQEAGLGIIALSCMYACIIVSGILAPAIIRLFGEKRVLVVSFLCHVIYTGTNFYPTFATLIPSSVLLGMTAGPMWTSQSVYLSDRAYSYAARTGEDSQVILTKYNGIFFSMFETTQITGNLISSLVLQQGTYGDPDINSTSVNSTKYCGSSDCPREVNATSIEEPDRKVVYILLGIFLICDVIGLLLTAFFLPTLNKKLTAVNGSTLKSIVSCGKGLFDVELALLVPLFMFMAMEQAVLWIDFTKAFISCPIGIQKLGFVMAGYGGSTTFFALTLSWVSKYIPRYVMFGLASVINVGTFLIMYFWTPTENDTIYIFIIPIAWGLSEGIWQTQSNAMVAHLFEKKKEPAFANYHTWKAVGFTITFVYSSFLCVSTKLIIAIGLAVASMLCYAVVEVRFQRRSNAIQR